MKSKLENLKFLSLCKSEGLPEPTPEYKFHDTRRWRIDYYFENETKRVGLEVEGGVWTNGRHTRGSGFVKDMEKYNAMALEGIFLLRVTPKDLNTVKTIEMVKRALSA